jgi:hypothetical protein
VDSILKDLDNYWNDFTAKDREFSLSFGDDSYIFTYGTTPFETFKELVNQIKEPPKRFVVLGSSIGWQCFFWNHLFPHIPVVGYEIHDVRFDYACYIAEKHNLTNITLYNDDLLNFEIKDGDLIWENNLCLDDEDGNNLCDGINWKALSLYNDIKIISYQRPLPSHHSLDKLVLVDNNGQFKGYTTNLFRLPVSWSKKQSFFITQ